MKVRRFFILSLFALALALGCKSEYEMLLESNDVEAKYSAAFDYFNEGRYQRAAKLFESISIMTSGTSRDDTVQYYWGLSNYRDRDYYVAKVNFDKFLERFPGSPFSETARYLRVDCMFKSTLRYELDQNPTYVAISGIEEYLLDCPNEERRQMCQQMLDELDARLDKKAFENAKIYYTMEDYKAARVALRNVLKDDADNRYREDILYLQAMSSYKYAKNSIEEKKKERYIQFVDDYLNFVGEYPESKRRDELDKLYDKVKK